MEGPAPLLSVCVITYNHAPYIRQALDGVLAQAAPFPWELIVADDCSTDGTRDILLEYRDRHPDRIRLILQEKNVGPERNWFDLLGAPRAPYIAYFEGDDYWTDPDKLRKQVEFLEANSGYAGCAHQALIVQDGRELRRFREDVPEVIGVEELIGGRPFHTASLVFRREAFMLLDRLPRAFSGDRLLNFCVAITGKIRFLPDCMCVYRWHGTGVSSGAIPARMRSDLEVIPALAAVYPGFPRYRYASYVYATLGLLTRATILEKLRYLSLSFLFSFSYFPRNLMFGLGKIVKAARRT